MCFLGENKKLIANEDIVCYKVLRKICFRYYALCCTEFRYKKNKLYKTEIKAERCYQRFEGIYIEEGFHSSNSIYTAKIEWMYGAIGITRVLAKFIIPKGAEYYENDKERVSNQIIFKKIIKS